MNICSVSKLVGNDELYEYVINIFSVSAHLNMGALQIVQLKEVMYGTSLML